MLIRFYTRAFRFLVGICCWLLLLGGLIGGIVIGGFIDVASMGIAAITATDAAGKAGTMGMMTLICGAVGFFGALFTEIMVVAPMMVLFTIDSRVKGIDQVVNGSKSLN